MLTREAFKEAVNAWKDSYEECDKFEAAIGAFCECRPIVELGMSCRNALAKLIGTTCGFYEEEDDLLYWWAFEKAPKIITVKKDGNETIYDVATIDGLYDYIVACYNTDG